MPELEKYWGSIQICPYLDSLSAVYLRQSDLEKAFSNGMLGTRALVPNDTLVFCAFMLNEDTQDISDPTLACFQAWVHHSQKLYTVQDTADWAISQHQKGCHMVMLAHLWFDSRVVPSPRAFPKVSVYFPTYQMPPFSMGEGPLSILQVRWLLCSYRPGFQDQVLVIPWEFTPDGQAKQRSLLYRTQSRSEAVAVHWPGNHYPN